MPRKEYIGDLEDMIQTEMVEEADSIAKPLPILSEEIPETEIARKKYKKNYEK